MKHKRVSHDNNVLGSRTRPECGVLRRKCDCGAHGIFGSSCGSKQNQGYNIRKFSEGMATGVEHSRYPFSATIRTVPAPDHPRHRLSSINRLTAIADDDSLLGPEKEKSDAIPLTENSNTAPAARILEPAEGETIHLPDIFSVATSLGFEDSIKSRLAYNSSIAKGGGTPRGFGITRPYTHAMSAITVTRTNSTYEVKASVDNPIKFQVRDSKGPRRQTDITSHSDADITNTNYPTVVSNLTPCSFPSKRAECNNMKGRRIEGKSPRDKFWARDLTIKHERFHARESVTHGRSGVGSAQNWLNGATATSVKGVQTLLNKVPARVAKTLKAEMTMPAREERAYADGVESYRTRAEAIAEKGKAGKYLV